MAASSLASPPPPLAVAGTTKVEGTFAAPQTVVIPAKAGIQYAAAFRFYHERLWNTGSPAFAGDDDWGLIFKQLRASTDTRRYPRGAMRPSYALTSALWSNRVGSSPVIDRP